MAWWYEFRMRILGIWRQRFIQRGFWVSYVYIVYTLHFSIRRSGIQQPVSDGKPCFHGNRLSFVKRDRIFERFRKSGHESQ